MELNSEKTCSKCMQLGLYHSAHPLIMLAQKRVKQAISPFRIYCPVALTYLPFILLINSKLIFIVDFLPLSLKRVSDCYFKTVESAQDVAGTMPIRGIQTSHELLWHTYSMQCFYLITSSS